jgi:hypothetical protein
MTKTLDRRGFIRVAAVSGAATGAALVGLAKAVDAAAGGDGDAAVGTIVSVGDRGIVIDTGDGRLSVRPAPSAQMYSGAFGEIQEPSSFIVGDRVAVNGVRQGPALEATFIGSIYSRVAATVTELSSDRSIAHTTIGDIELEAGRLPFTSPSHQARLRDLGEVTKGRTINGLAWVHPETDEIYLLIGN